MKAFLPILCILIATKDLSRDILSLRAVADRAQTLVSISLKGLTHAHAYNYKPKRSSWQHAFHAPNGFLRLFRRLIKVGLATM